MKEKRFIILIISFVVLFSCIKFKELPTVTTTVVTSVTASTAISGGNITADGGGTITARGVCYATTVNPTISNFLTIDGTGTGAFPSSLTGLTASTTYFVRAYATNSAGTAYGSQVNFTTAPNVAMPTVSTAALSAITQTTASGGGNITSDGGGSVTARGVCWSTTQNPTTANTTYSNGTGTGSFISSLTGLLANTTYYIRAYATNSAGTSYGNELFFTTYAATDADGNNYTSVVLGTQIWLKENLKTTKYNDNATIPLITDINVWAALTTPGYCWYNNDGAAYKAPYGAMYNWYVVDLASNGGRNVCPIGWHVPDDSEWTILTNYLGGESVAGAKLKEISTIHWISPNAGATNETGFTALPGGGRNYDGYYGNIGTTGIWWSSTDLPTTSAIGRGMRYDEISVSRYGYYERDGLSVRCLKD